jgi:uncharacterized repeat protein (TIGR01451 family)
MRKYYTLLLICIACIGQAQTINFPDVKLKERLVLAASEYEIAKDFNGAYVAIDTNGNAEIEISEALNIAELDISQAQITNIAGLQNFTNLVKLTCESNNIAIYDLTDLNALTSLDISYNTAPTVTFSGAPNLKDFAAINIYCQALNLTSFIQLENVWCYMSALTQLNVTGLSHLKKLECFQTAITALDLSGLTSLEYLYISSCGMITLSNLSDTSQSLETLISGGNNFTSIDLNGFTELKEVDLSESNLTTINLTGLTKLEALDVDNNNINSIIFGGNANFDRLFINGNQLTTLDVSELRAFDYLYCKNNPLATIFAKNGRNVYIDFGNNPTLEYICTDETNLQLMQNIVISYGMSNCMVGSYCTFEPGGPRSLVEINAHFGTTCDNTPNFPLLKLNVANESSVGTFVANGTGHFSTSLPPGTYQITPVLENPTYFNISPDHLTVTLPGQDSPVVGNFCITPVSTRRDLDIHIVPMTVARPGFNCTYSLIFHNKGNFIQSGSVSLVYPDALIDFVSAVPTNAGASINALHWNFIDLAPMETRTIQVTFNINSPVEIPPVNINDVLQYAAIVETIEVDETPQDNTFGLKQTVVGSLDPNDKTCLEGASVSQEVIGSDVHYLIRFENTGTFHAENIVVKDMIDTSKFDINTLIPISGSHAFVTRISENNKVEFIFKNINLPFDDANNDGYVAFKIKTQPTLVVGDSFTNSANIYFDYNFPILTNTATTTVQTLGTPDFDFSKYFALYPNPAINVLHIKCKTDVEIQSLKFYNILGQLVLDVLHPQESIDVSNLKTGNYFIKVHSDKGMSTSKFIKE